MILADKIVRLRKKNGWSQEELAAEDECHLRQAVSKWESAQTIPELEKNFAAWSVVWSYDRLPFKG